MFNSEFFPTPKSVIKKMIGDHFVYDKVVLEPSAGKGDIVDYIKDLGVKEILAFEKEDDLRTILSKKCTVLGNDFMQCTAQQISHIEYIFMNPPFSNADQHILHAFEVMPEGCVLVALCNYETIKNDYTRTRRLLTYKIKEYGVSVNLGNVFSSAERITGIDVGMITLTKPVVNDRSKYEGFFMDADEEESSNSGLIQYNEVREIVGRYVGALKAFDEFTESANMLNSNIGEVVGSSQVVSVSVEYGKSTMDKEVFAKQLQKKSWEWIIRKMKIDKFVTSGVMKDINKFVEQQVAIPFTMKNIYKMMEIIVATRSQTMDRAIIEVFDKITLHHAKNRQNVEGWKTNKHYMVGEKFILEWCCEQGWSGEMDFRYNGNIDKMEDFTKALCYLTGVSVDYPSLYNWARNEMVDVVGSDGVKKRINKSKKNTLKFNTWYDWGFFEIKGFKKGTLHVKFKNRDHWAVFNQRVGKIKGFPLPESM